MVVVYIMTDDLAIMASIGVVDIVAQLFFYYLHERTWGKISWGVTAKLPPKAPAKRVR